MLRISIRVIINVDRVFHMMVARCPTMAEIPGFILRLVALPGGLEGMKIDCGTLLVTGEAREAEAIIYSLADELKISIVKATPDDVKLAHCTKDLGGGIL